MTTGTKIIIALLIPISLVALGVLMSSAFSIFGPAIAENRRIQDDRAKCALSLKLIGLSATMYADAHPGRPLPALKDLAKEEDISSDDLKCPTSGQPFIYVGKGVVGKDVATVIAYESAESHGRGMNFLYADGSVKWHSADEATRLILKLISGQNPPK